MAHLPGISLYEDGVFNSSLDAPAGKSCPKSAEGFSTWIRVLQVVFTSQKEKKHLKNSIQARTLHGKREEGNFYFPFSLRSFSEGGKRLGKAEKKMVKKN